jgi:hypothetical protein
MTLQDAHARLVRVLRSSKCEVAADHLREIGAEKSAVIIASLVVNAGPLTAAVEDLLEAKRAFRLMKR